MKGKKPFKTITIEDVQKSQKKKQEQEDQREKKATAQTIVLPLENNIPIAATLKHARERGFSLDD